jgi:sphingosine kinase
MSVSGDGIVHELYNGMLENKQPLRALKIPIAPVPAGSGNSISLNVLGLEVGNFSMFNHFIN